MIDLFSEAISISQEMLAAAQTGQWDLFKIQQKQREDIIRKLFTKPLTEISDNLRAQLQMLQMLDQQLIAQGISQREELAQELQKINYARRSVQNYLDLYLD